MLPTTTETAKQIRTRLVAEYNALAAEYARQGRTDLAASYRWLADAFTALELGQ